MSMQEFSDQMPSDIERFPMVPIRDVVIFPYTKVAFKIGRPSSVRALEQAMTGERNIFLATQHDASIDEPNADQIFTTGTLGRIVQAQRQDNGQIKVVVEGRERGRAVRVEHDADGMFYAHVRRVPSTDESGYRTRGVEADVEASADASLVGQRCGDGLPACRLPGRSLPVRRRRRYMHRSYVQRVCRAWRQGIARRLLLRQPLYDPDRAVLMCSLHPFSNPVRDDRE